MRYFPALIAAAVMLGVAACGPGIKLPPVAPEDVEVFMPGSYPTDDFKVLSRIEQSVPLSVSDRDLIEQAKAKAAEMGADALLIDSIRRTTEGGVVINPGEQEEKILEGRAIYYPSKHPELSNK